MSVINFKKGLVTPVNLDFPAKEQVSKENASSQSVVYGVSISRGPDPVLPRKIALLMILLSRSDQNPQFWCYKNISDTLITASFYNNRLFKVGWITIESRSLVFISLCIFLKDSISIAAYTSPETTGALNSYTDFTIGIQDKISIS